MLQFTDYRVKIFDPTYKTATLVKDEYCLFQNILISFFNHHSTSILKLSYKDYKIQYIPVIDTNGRKLVLINGFCKNYTDFTGNSWKEELIRPFDGGPCYFLGTVDLTDKVIKNMWFNGEARLKKLNKHDEVQECDATEVK
jgi:hypothetical protein